MDLVRLLEDAIDGLPVGDHTPGLRSIVRHVKSAIRHLEREDDDDPDSCTDAIYRTNQAFEGSLKEAYRVLAKMEPAGKSPFQIENYIEEHNFIRPRVLTQLTRYRQDYRNPSTHDYRLDFDADEALLAIVSVCAFAKLLVNQIASKLASDEAHAIVSTLAVQPAPDQSKTEQIARVCLLYTQAAANVGWFEFELGIQQSLEEAGFRVVNNIGDGSSPDIPLWDLMVEADEEKIGIDTRMSWHSRDGQRLPVLFYGDDFGEGVTSAVLIIRDKKRSGYSLFETPTAPRGDLLVIMEAGDEKQAAAIIEDFGALNKLET